MDTLQKTAVAREANEMTTCSLDHHAKPSKTTFRILCTISDTKEVNWKQGRRRRLIGERVSVIAMSRG